MGTPGQAIDLNDLFTDPAAKTGDDGTSRYRVDIASLH